MLNYDWNRDLAHRCWLVSYCRAIRQRHRSHKSLMATMMLLEN